MKRLNWVLVIPFRFQANMVKVLPIYTKRFVQFFRVKSATNMMT